MTAPKPSARPTRKWMAARATAASAWAVLVITNGFHREAAVALVGLLTEAAVAYLTPNTQDQP